MSLHATREPGRWEQAPRAGTVKPSPDCPLPQRVRQAGQKLLNQQFWLWGQDVRHAPNLLARYGFAHTARRLPGALAARRLPGPGDHPGLGAAGSGV